MILKTKRLILRTPKISDWKDVVEGIGDLEVSKNMRKVPYPYTKKDALNWIRETIGKEGNNRYDFMIELTSENRVIGCIVLSSIDKFDGTASTGSWINRKYWRKGYITEAKIAVNNFAFEKLKLRKLKSSVFADNIASNRTQQSIGYRLEGCRKKDIKSLATGEIKDDNLYGLLKEDWKRNLPKIKKRLNKK